MSEISPHVLHERALRAEQDERWRLEDQRTREQEEAERRTWQEAAQAWQGARDE
jgi:hypothetical protein